MTLDIGGVFTCPSSFSWSTWFPFAKCLLKISQNLFDQLISFLVETWSKGGQNFVPMIWDQVASWIIRHLCGIIRLSLDVLMGCLPCWLCFIKKQSLNAGRCIWKHHQSKSWTIEATVKAKIECLELGQLPSTNVGQWPVKHEAFSRTSYQFTVGATIRWE